MTLTLPLTSTLMLPASDAGAYAFIAKRRRKTACGATPCATVDVPLRSAAACRTAIRPRSCFVLPDAASARGARPASAEVLARRRAEELPVNPKELRV
ncbi:MAG TPA: hypothetical protein VNN72_11380, partial [Polyangiaceae bacterium]|nr:hypothetical protein [Polyangiaceae bacterium]